MDDIVMKYKSDKGRKKSERPVLVVNGATWVLILLKFDSLIQTNKRQTQESMSSACILCVTGVALSECSIDL